MQSDILKINATKGAREISQEGEVNEVSTTDTIADAVTEARKNATQNSDFVVSYEKLMALVEQYTTTAYEYFRSVSSVASPEERTNIERRLADIERKIVEANELIDSKSQSTTTASTTVTSNKDASHVLLRSALTDTQKLISYMTDIDIRTQVTIDELIPVVPTKEEKKISIEENLKKIIAETESVEHSLDTIQNQSVKDKITYGLSQVTKNASSTKYALAQGSFDEAQKSSEEALIMLDDLLKLAKANEVTQESIDSTIEEEIPIESLIEVSTTTQKTSTTTATSTESDST